VALSVVLAIGDHYNVTFVQLEPLTSSPGFRPFVVASTPE
jgi:hypothetical protein